MKARIFKPGEHRGIVLTGNVLSFYLGTEGWNLTLDKDSTKENEEFYDEIVKMNERGPADILKKANLMKTIRSRMVLNENGTVWIGFALESGYRVQVFNEEKQV